MESTLSQERHYSTVLTTIAQVHCSNEEHIAEKALIFTIWYMLMYYKLYPLGEIRFSSGPHYIVGHAAFKYFE